MASDEEDVAAVVGGDIDRFERIVRRYERPLLHMALRFTTDRSAAEEMTHMAFVSCYRSLAKWRGDSAFSTWLFSVALNVYRSHLRRMQPSSVSLDEAINLGESPEATLSAKDVAAIVRRAVMFLPAKYRDPLITFYFRDEDLSETAKILGLPEGTVKTRLHRGRKLLAERLETLPGRKSMMDMDTIDAALRNQPDGSLSSLFERRVMNAIGEEVRPPLRFPWLRTVAAIELGTLAVILTGQPIGDEFLPAALVVTAVSLAMVERLACS